MVVIELNGEELRLKFGYGVFRRLGDKWGIDSVDGVFNRFGSFVSDEGESVKFETINLLGDLLEASADNAGCSLNNDDAVDYLLSNPEQMQIVIKAFVDSLPVDKKKTQ